MASNTYTWHQLILLPQSRLLSSHESNFFCWTIITSTSFLYLTVKHIFLLLFFCLSPHTYYYLNTQL